MGWVYLLRCSDDSFYVGSARDLGERLAQHSHAQIGYTAKRRPVTLEWCAEADIPDAYAMERRIHGWSRRKKQALIDGEIDLLHLLGTRGRARRDLDRTLRDVDALRASTPQGPDSNNGPEYAKPDP